METNRKISTTGYLLIFGILILLLGTVSFYKLVNFYVNDVTDYNEWSAKLGNKFETDEASSFYQKMAFVNGNGMMRKVLGQRQMNGVVKLNNGYLLTPYAYVPDETLEGFAQNVIALHDYLSQKDTAMLYAITPYTSSKYDPQLPSGITDFGNDNIDRFMTMLDSANVDTLDYRQQMYLDGLNQYDMMYRTDHHWTTRAGFYAYCKLEDYLTQKLSCEVDPRISNLENYTITTYKNWHLGSRGQRTGIYFTGSDDFELIIPDFETTIQHNDTIGQMQDLVINSSPLQDKDYTSRYTYDNVLGGSLGSFTNLNCPNDKKLLIVTDSFGKAVNPYLIMAFSEIRYIYDGSSEQLTKEYLESYKPDAVILLYYPDCLNKKSTAFNFQEFINSP